MGYVAYVFIAILIIVILIVVLWYFWRGNCGSQGCENNGSQCVGVDSQTAEVLNLTIFNTGETGATGPFEISLTSGWVNVLQTQVTTCSPCTTFLATVSAVTSAVVFDTGLFDIVGEGSTEFVQIQFQVLVDGTIVSSPTTAVTFNELLHVKAADTSFEDTSFLMLELLGMSQANSFQWVYKGVCAGTHSVVVQAQVLMEDVVTPSVISSVSALVGPRTLSVQQVKLCCPKPTCRTSC